MRMFLAVTAITVFAQLTCAAEPVEIDLWPVRPPGVAEDEKLEVTSVVDEKIGIKITKVSKPTLTVYRPAAESANGAAVVVCPGGGYHILAWDLEGTEVAKWLNGIGVTAIVLKYRVPRTKSEPHFVPPLRDAQRALRLSRKNAKEWGIDAERIGILGFSAGGNLSALAATNFDNVRYDAIDVADEQSCRPDFCCLIYPAYLTKEQDKRMTDLTLAENLPVNERTPPTFLVHTGDDGISAANSLGFYLALKNHKVPAELHVYPKGGHGYGLRPTENAVSSWPDRAARWFKTIGVISE